jgi:ATP-dependent helicase/nuclease subunit B
MPDGHMAANGGVHRARIFTIPPGQPFLVALARAILAGDLPVPSGMPPDPMSLPSYTLLLPTRRAARALQDAFLRVSGGRALLLPRIRPIAEGQEDLGLLEGAAEQGSLADHMDDLPPAITELERRLVLTRLVMAWAEAQRRADTREGLQPFAGASARTPAQAVRLSTDLVRLMDAVETENASLAGLEDLVPETLSEHWQTTLEFLKIVTEAWPAYLEERGLSSPMERRNRLVLGEAARLAARPPAGPVIVAGVTGSVPATAELMRAVSQLPQGAIVLPALDQGLDAETWAALTRADPGHPQLALRVLLDRLGYSREHVTMLPGCNLQTARALRNHVVAQAMRPAATTVQWRTFASTVDTAAISEALAGVSLIEASREQDEAEAIALILRESLETPGRTAALVSPDRLLARRVATRLQSWGVRVDDSAGRPFAKTVPGAFLDLVVEAIGSDFAPAHLMALLKHPLTRLGLPVGQMRRASRSLEIAAFRTVYLGRGLAGVEAALERAARESSAGVRRDRSVRRLWDVDWTAMRDLLRRLQAATAPLAAHFEKRDPVPLATLAAAHIEAAEALARPADEGQPSLVWQGEAGEAAAKLFAGLMDEAMPAPLLAATDYAEFYRSLIAGENVRPRVPVHPRLSIWGPFEARLQQADVMVLGSLNEGTWPAAADPGAWLNRPMREALGLPAPEEEIGRAAHDFTTFLGADRVFLTRATKVDGAPTVPSRWLMRLRALLDGLELGDVLDAREPWLAWARARNHVQQRRPVSAPEPRPPVAARPRRASVSDVEQWIKNPYGIFARHVLGLEELSQLGAEPGPREKGQIVHEALSRFAARYPDRLPSNVAGELLRAAQEVLQELVGHPRVAAFWLPRLARFADWFAETEAARRLGVDRLVTEVSGELVLDAPTGPFTLRARADRIDATGKGLIITDYKTGALPSDKAVMTGLAPQLPLEAAIVTAGGFQRVPARPVMALRYIRATGAEPAGEERVVNAGDVGSLAADALQGLARLVARFDDASTPYQAVRRARFKYDYDSYAHLARVAEWSGARGEEDE